VTELRTLEMADFTRMNLPAEFRKVKPEDIPESIREPISRYVSQVDQMLRDGLGLLLHGPAGVGKTTTAAYVACEVRRRAYPVFFVTVSDLREMIRTRVGVDDGTVLERVRRVKLLVLDSLRAEDATDSFFGAVDLARLLEARSSWNRATIVTTQIAPAALRTSFPGMMEQARTACVEIKVTGPNRRDHVQEKLQERLGITRKGV
jgi:DNA replication protein DnaC